MKIEKIMNKIRYIKTANDLSLLIDKKQEIENETNISVMIVRSNFLFVQKFFNLVIIKVLRFVIINNKIPKPKSDTKCNFIVDKK